MLKLTSLRLMALIAALTLLAGCSVNPVTGERQLSLISEADERSIGEEQYKPTQQTQGGKYYLEPELNDYISEVGQRMAEVSDRPDLPYEFVVLNSSVPNAWALPSGKIAINRGLLLEFEDEAQLASVLGHEIVHAAARHSVQRMQRGMLINAGVAGLGIGLAMTDNEFAGLLMGGAAVGSQLIMARYSQDAELESDHYGIRYMVEAGYDPQAAVELQEIFVRLSEGRESGFIDGLFASHPPSQKRVEENRELAQKLGVGGKRYRERYQQKIAGLKKRQPAYEAHDEARKLASEEQFNQALGKINEAIRLEPREAAFYALRGNIYEAQDRDDEARADYDEAVSLYPEMFTYRLYRGLDALERDQFDLAREDLEQANQVVPTSIAFLRLGDIAVQENQRDQAVSYYRTAAGAQGAVAQEAQQKLERLTGN